MKTCRSLILYLALTAISLSAQAFEQDYSAKIISAYVNSGGLVLIKIDSNTSWLEVGQAGDPVVDVMYSTALAAKVSERTDVWVRWIPQSAGYPKVTIVSIGK